MILIPRMQRKSSTFFQKSCYKCSSENCCIPYSANGAKILADNGTINITPCGQRPRRDYLRKRETTEFQYHYLLIGSGIISIWRRRSWSRRAAHDPGRKSRAAVAARCRAEDGEAYLLEFFHRRAASTISIIPSPQRAESWHRHGRHPYNYDPTTPAEMYRPRGDKSVLVRKCCTSCLASCWLVLIRPASSTERGKKRWKLDILNGGAGRLPGGLFRDGGRAGRSCTGCESRPGDAQDEDDLLTAAVNRAILEGFSPLFAQLMAEHGLQPVTDPDFELLAVNRAEGFRVGAQFFCLPPLELGNTPALSSPSSPGPSGN